MDAKTLIDDAGRRAGWTDATRLIVLTQFVDHVSQGEQLRKYLERRLKEEDAPPVEPELLEPVVRAEIYADDRRLQTVADVTWALATTGDRELVQLLSGGGPNDYAAAEALARRLEESDLEVGRVLGYCRASRDVGFNCDVADEQLRAWLKRHKPYLLVEPDLRLTARFVPQVWVNDYATEVDPEGETEWDCTAFLKREYPEELPQVQVETENGDEWLDRDDLLKDDPDAPEWVREWSGPFSIYVREGAL